MRCWPAPAGASDTWESKQPTDKLSTRLKNGLGPVDGDRSYLSDDVSYAVPAKRLTRRNNLMSSMPAPKLQFTEPRGSAVIGIGVTIKGQIFSREDLIIDGEVEGSVELQEHRLTIGEKGKIRADVSAHEVVVLGSIDGNVEAKEKIDIRKQASITGDIRAARIETEDGAYLKGSVDTRR